MITCRKCNTINPTEATHCEHCGVDLLPGETFKDRLVIFLFGIFGGLLSAGVLYFLMQNPELTETSECCLLTNPYAWVIGIFFFPISAIVNALRKTPPYQRYENRANFHLKKDPEQALSDFSEAINLAPPKKKAALLKQRADLNKSMGKEESFLEDRLAYMESEGAYEGQANLAQTFKLDSDQFVAGARDSERKNLLTEGKIKAVGFCKQCQQAVELNKKSRCPIHPKKKPIVVKYCLPKDFEANFAEVAMEGAEKFKKTRRTRKIVFIILLVVILFACVIPLLITYLPRLLGQ